VEQNVAATAPGGDGGAGGLTALSSTTMLVEIWSDVVCPWCFIGKRKLEVALADMARTAPALNVTIDTAGPTFASGLVTFLLVQATDRASINPSSVINGMRRDMRTSGKNFSATSTGSAECVGSGQARCNKA
jgi:hypothetical protein